MDTRKKLVPIMKEARRKGQDAYIAVDKLYIDKQLYREPDPATDVKGPCESDLRFIQWNTEGLTEAKQSCEHFTNF